MIFPVSTLLVAVLLGLVHLFGQRLASWLPGSHDRWLSVSAGLTVTFVFLYLLPELDYFRRILAQQWGIELVDELLYLATLGGVTIYYGLEHLAYQVRTTDGEAPETATDHGHDYVFWLHMGWYALYNVIIGALLLYGHQETVQGLLVYGGTIAVHFLSIDAAMRRHHRHIYHMTGRWVLAAAVVVGWAIGVLAPVSTTTLAFVTAFIIGGLLINALKEEVPSSQKTHFVPFVVAAALFSVVLVVF